MTNNLMKFKQLVPILFGFAPLLAPLPADASDYFSPRSAGLAGAGIAGPLLNDSLYMNPSYASFLPTYALGFSLNTYGSQTDATHGRAYSLSVLDGRNPLFQAGLAYTVRQDHSFIHLGASKSFIQNWGMGLSAKFFFNPRANTSGQELSLSSTYVFSPWVQSAILIDNLVESDNGKRAGLYREITVGGKFNVDKILLIYADPHVAPSLSSDSLGYALGVEFVVMQDVFFRVGKSVNANVPQLDIRGDGYGIGLGWVAPRISLDYAMHRTTSPLNVTTHTFGATTFF